MSKKSGLLSIGDISKFTGVSIKALRYYERIGILKPAYVDPDSLYRYYNFNQT
ncbi:MAG: MerR family DNA-binding transcriptional regulator, partial [Oscillospiraceae bacterium]|nr:MerR family DNA-binding transcriptional regulator [Oscillospiraceae bacterium]